MKALHQRLPLILTDPMAWTRFRTGCVPLGRWQVLVFKYHWDGWRAAINACAPNRQLKAWRSLSEVLSKVCPSWDSTMLQCISFGMSPPSEKAPVQGISLCFNKNVAVKSMYNETKQRKTGVSRGILPEARGVPWLSELATGPKTQTIWGICARVPLGGNHGCCH
jgi:hypothetical protein